MTLKVGFANAAMPGSNTTVNLTDSGAGFASDIKAAIVLSSGATANDTAAVSSRFMVGLASNNAGTLESSATITGEDNASPSGEALSNSSTKVYSKNNGVQIANLSSWTATDGITLNETTSTDTAAYKTNAFLFGGDIEAKRLKFDWAAATGNKAVAHGLGGAPEVLIGICPVASADNTLNDGRIGLGFWATGGGQNGVGVFAGNGLTTTFIAMNSSASLWPMTTAAAGTHIDFTVGTVDATSVNISASASITTTLYVLALRGLTTPLQAAVGTIASPTSTSSTSITGLAFKPQALLMWGGRQTALGQSLDDGASCLSFGGAITNSGGIKQGSISTDMDDALAQPSDRNDQTSVLHMLNTLAVNGGASQNKGDVTSFNSDGATISWTITTATAFQHGYLAFAQAGNSVPVITKLYRQRRSG